MDTAPSPVRDEGPLWAREAICWQVYPLGFCGAPTRRNGLSAESYGDVPEEHGVHRLGRTEGWLDHLVALGANVLLLGPVFESVSHGYDTLDHRRIDPRLGDEDDIDALIAACHKRGVRVVLDGVFNHLSESHPVVRRAVAAGPDSEAGRWIRWSGEHPYGFEGNPDLVELDLSEPAVQGWAAGHMSHWLDRGIDGWRLDAMYSAGAEAWRPVLARVRAEHPGAWILGEVIHGEYRDFALASGADSITQYELWKAVWSSIRDRNLWELAHALGRHEAFVHGETDGPDEGGAARTGSDTDRAFLPLTFLGNHDTTRIASQLPDGRDLAVACAVLALLPGVPCVYAGDELGATGVKEERAGGDDAVRPVFPDEPEAVLGADGVRAGTPAPAGTDPHGAFPALALLSPAAAPRILEVHRRLFALRRREPWLSRATVRVEQSTLTNTWAEIVLDTRLRLLLNLGEDPVPVPGEILERVSGADMLDAVGLPGAGQVPAHGAAVVRGGEA